MKANSLLRTTWSLHRRVDQACNRFESAWHSPQRPHIEDFLADASSAGRPALLRELILIEADYRRARGEACRPAEYAARFPDLDAAWLADELEEPSTDVVRYRPVRFHARGGLGEVHVALDTELRRPVALKRIQERHRADPECRRRFLREAEITGRLEHPGIVPVYGLIHDADGQPCYAMRYVEGESLRDAVRRLHGTVPVPPTERGLLLRQLLTRLVTVCHTIAYAHSRGVLHRDLKPANILLGKYGETLVIDWGLARSVGERDGDGPGTRRTNDAPCDASTLALTHSLTRAGQVIGTPAYMSPDQAAGHATPAGDIYSLGAVLYTLLTGKAPFDGDDLDALLDRVRQGTFVPPRRVNPEVPRPLQAICLKAMALRPEERYQSAQELADDLEHWLADEPVTAFRELWRTRLGRMARRRKALVACAAALLLATVAFLSALAVILFQAQERVEAQKLRAETSYRLARDSLRKLAREAVESPELKHGPQAQWLEKILKANLLFSEEFVRLRGDEPSFRAERGQTFLEMGYSTRVLNKLTDAVAHYQEARGVFAALAREYPSVPEYRTELGQSYLGLATVYWIAGEKQSAERAYRDAVAINQDLTRAYPDTPEFQAALAKSRHDLGRFYWHAGQSQLAEQPLHDALAIQERLARAHPAVPQYRRDLAVTHFNLGRLYTVLDRFPQAIQALEEARAAQQRLVHAHPSIPQYEFDLSRTHLSLGNAYRHVGRVAEAAEELRAAVAIQDRLLKRFPHDGQTAVVRAGTLQTLGRVETDLGRGAE